MTTQDSLRFLHRSSEVINRVPGNSGLLREGDEAAEGQEGAEIGVVHLVPADNGGNPKLKDSSAGVYVKVGTSLNQASNNKVIRIGPAYVTASGTRPDQRELNNGDIDYTGAFWFREDTKDLAINTTGEHNAEAWHSLTPRYTNLAPMVETVGGLQAGTTFNNDTLTSILDRLLYPASRIELTNFTITPDPTTNPVLEVGETIPAPGGLNNRTLAASFFNESSVANVVYFAGNNLDLMVEASSYFAGSSYNGSGAGRTFTYTQSQSMTYSQPTTFYWQVKTLDLVGNLIPRAHKSVEWRYKTFVCLSANPNVTDPTALSSGVSSSLGRINQVVKEASVNPEYIYVFLPVGRSEGSPVLDGYAPYSSFTLGSGGPATVTRVTAFNPVTITRNGVNVLYHIYRTTYPSVGAFTLNLN